MRTYLLESSLSLLLTFGFYKLVLEKERLPSFKRFYLLGSLLVSALVPLLAIEVGAGLSLLPAPVVAKPSVLTPAPVDASSLASNLDANVPLPANSEEVEQVDYEAYGLLLYGCVMLVLLLRFSVNVGRLVRQAATYPRQSFQGATLVLLPGRGLPYAFLHYLFVSAAAFQRGEIEEELFTHELVHIRQRHSLDVLLIELLLCLGWFNPVLYGMRQAMQLNHEFLADEAVNQRHHDPLRYQHLLVSKAADASHTALTSALTFQTTKQRLLMMTKHTSRAKRWANLGSTALLFVTLVAALGTTAAQTAPVTAPSLPAVRQQPKNKPATRPSPILEPEKLIGDKLVKLVDGKRKKYSELSALEKQWVFYSPLPPRRTPTEEQWTAWHNPKMYGIWVDEKRLRGDALKAYKRADIVEFSGSYVHKNARQPEGYKYQMSLTTEQEYQKMVKEHEVAPFIVMIPLKLMQQHATSEGGAKAIIQQYGDLPVYSDAPPLSKADPGKVYKMYSALSSEEKKQVGVFRRTHMPVRVPAETQWAAWKNNEKWFGIWLHDHGSQKQNQGKRLQGQALNAYNRTDIAYFTKSYNREKARNPKQYTYRIDLFTHQARKEELQIAIDTLPKLFLSRPIAVRKALSRKQSE